MKLTYPITMASALLLAAGCAHEESSVGTGGTDYSSGRMSEYNNQNPPASVGGSYSADGSYSSGGGETYASRPGGKYAGTVGADGTYTPFANSESSSAVAPVSAGAYAGSAGTESDYAVVSQVRESLRQDPEIAPVVSSLQISAHNGAILLIGSVQSEEQKHRIYSKVLGVTGVVAVNNQLNVMAGGPNANGANPQGSQLYPTGNNSDSHRLYKDSDGRDTSTNNALNPTSRPGSSSQIYHESDHGQNENSGTNNVQHMPTP